MKIEKVTPILIVDEIEPSLALYEKKLKYERKVEVPHEDKLGFVILSRAGGDIMMQTRASLAADLPAIAAREPEVVLYVDVDSLEAAQRATKGAEIIVKERTTFYGAKEFAVRDPAGRILLFASKA